MHRYYLLTIFVLILCCSKPRTTEKFDSVRWKKGNERERGNMADDLVDSETLDEMNKAQVKDLLGFPSDSTEFWYDYTLDYGSSTPYHLQIMFDSTGVNVIDVDLGD